MRCLVSGCKNFRLSRNRPVPKGTKKYCDPSIGFFRLPNKWVRISEGYGETRSSILTRERRQAWIDALTKDEELTESQLSNGRVCSRHFTSEKPSSLENKKNADWVPHLHMNSENCCYGCSRKCHRKDEEETNSDTNKGTKPSVSSEEMKIENPEPKENQEAVEKSDPLTKRCRTCLAVTDTSKCIHLTSDLLSIKELKNMLKNLVGRMDLDTPENAIMCFKCEKILKLCHSFKTQCHRIEDGIKSLKLSQSKPKHTASKRNLRSSSKASKKFKDEEGSNSPRSAKRVKVKEEDEETEEETEEKPEQEDITLVLEDIEKDIKAEVDVDTDIIDLIRNEINNTGDTDIKDFLKSKFKSEPGVKIVPYVIPRQVICVTPNMVQKINDTSAKGNSKEKSNTKAKGKEDSVKEAHVMKNEIVMGDDEQVEIISVDIKDNEKEVTDVETKDKDDDVQKAAIEKRVMEISSDEDSWDDGTADDYFENFEPDWFKANEKKRRGGKKKSEPKVVDTKPLIVYTGEGSYVPTERKPKIELINKIMEQDAQIEKTLSQLQNTEGTESKSKRQRNRTVPQRGTAEKISSKELEAILEGKEESLPKKKDAKIGKIAVTNKLKTYSKEDLIKSYQNYPNKIEIVRENDTNSQIPKEGLRNPSITSSVRINATTITVVPKNTDNSKISETSLSANTPQSKPNEDPLAMEEELTNDGSAQTDDTFNSEILDTGFEPEEEPEAGTLSGAKIPDLPKSSSKLNNYFTVWSKLHNEDETFLATLHGPRYPCNKCRGSYNTKTGLRRHLRTHYCSPFEPTPGYTRTRKLSTPDAPCHVCGAVFRCSSSMYRHMKKHLDGSKASAFTLNPTPCNLCDKVFQSKHSLKMHLRVHYKKDPLKPDKKYVTVSPKEGATDDADKGFADFKCFMCDFKTDTNILLKNHYLTAHTDRNQNSEKETQYNFQCEICYNRYQFEEDLKHHVQDHFSHEDIASSNLHSTPSDDGDNSHEEVYSVFVCSKCGQGFSEVKALTQHLDNEHGGEQDIEEVDVKHEDFYEEEEYEFGFPSDEEDEDPDATVEESKIEYA